MNFGNNNNNNNNNFVGTFETLCVKNNFGIFE